MRDQPGDLDARQSLGEEARCDLGQLGPRPGEPVHIARLLDLVAELDRGLGTQPQQVAGRQGADHAAPVVRDAQMPDAQPVHARHRQERERLGRHGGERAGGDLSNRCTQGVGAAPCQRAHHVALGDNACLGRERRLLAALVAHEQRGHALLRHALQRDGNRVPERGEFCRRAHHVADAMTVGIAVDAHGRTAGVEGSAGLARLRPSGPMLLVDRLGQGAAGALGFGQRADAAFAQPRQQGEEDPSRG